MPSSPWSSAIRGNVALAPGSQKDAFDRLRTSQPYEVFSASCEYDGAPLHYENVITGSAAANYDSNISSVIMTVPAVVGDMIVRQSRYIRYSPGKSQQIFVSANFQGGPPDTRKRVGYFDDNLTGTGDGVFFEVDSTGIYAVRRSSVTGAMVDNRVDQASWNVDKLNDGKKYQCLRLNTVIRRLNPKG